MTISGEAFAKFAQRLSKIRDEASTKILDYINKNKFLDFADSADPEALKSFIDYCYGITTKYGEAAGALSAEMYDALAELSGVAAPPAVPGATPEYWEVRKTVDGVLKKSKSEKLLSAAIGRQVKSVEMSTMRKNAERDGAEVAWIPHGDSCPFCIMLASNGWKPARKAKYADHVHANCNCELCVRFDGKTNVKGYDPARYKAMYDGAEGNSWKEKLKSMRSEIEI